MATDATQRDRHLVTPPERYELSPVQQGALFHHLRAPASGAHHEQVVAELREVVDPAAMERAWRCAIAAHPMLRTAFTWESLDGPGQVVHGTVTFALQLLDWRNLDASWRTRQLDALLADDRANPFDLARAPLLRVTLVRLGHDYWLMAWSVPRVVLDGRSIPLVLSDVFAAYDAYRAGSEPSLPSRPPYRAFIAWLRERDTAADERFWRAALVGADLPTPIPAGAASEPVAYAEHDVTLDAGTTLALRSLASRGGVGMSTLVYAAWALLLARHVERDEVTFGVVRTGRRSVPDGDRMVGLLTTTVPLRVPVPRDATTGEWLAALRETQRATGRHEHAAPADIRRWSGVAPGQALYESLVVYDEATLDTQVKGLHGRWPARHFTVHERASCPIALYVWGEAELQLRIACDRSRLDHAAAAVLTRELIALLRALPHGIAEPLSAFLMPAAAVHHDVAVAAPALTTITTEFPSLA